MLSKRMPARRSVLCAALIAAAGATAGDVRAQPSEPAPTVESVEVARGAGSFVASDDLPVPPPNHPPIDTIPPMPMPVVSEPFLGPSGPGASVSFDVATRRESRTPIDPETTDPSQSGSSDSGLILGYPGADGGQLGDERRPARFGDMSLISPSRRAYWPWRRMRSSSCVSVMRMTPTGCIVGYRYDGGPGGRAHGWPLRL